MNTIVRLTEFGAIGVPGRVGILAPQDAATVLRQESGRAVQCMEAKIARVLRKKSVIRKKSVQRVGTVILMMSACLGHLGL